MVHKGSSLCGSPAGSRLKMKTYDDGSFSSLYADSFLCTAAAEPCGGQRDTTGDHKHPEMGLTRDPTTGGTAVPSWGESHQEKEICGGPSFSFS